MPKQSNLDVRNFDNLALLCKSEAQPTDFNNTSFASLIFAAK